MIRDHFLWKARPYYRQVAGLLLLGFVSGIVMNTSVVLPAILLGRAIDTVLLLDRGQATMREVFIVALLYVGGNALYFAMRMGKRWWLRTANQRTAANMRSNALRGVLAWPMVWLHNESVGDIMARVIGDVQVFITGFNEATTELLDTWLFSVSLFAAMLAYDVGLALMAMALVPLALLLAYYSATWVRSRTLAMRQANSNLTTALQEYLSGIRVLRLFGRTNEAVQRVDQLSERLCQANLAETRLRVGLQPVYSIMVTAGVLLVVWLGGQRVIEGTLTTGALVAFMQLYLRFVGRGYRIPMFFNRIQGAGVAYTRLERMLAPPPPLAVEPPRASFRPNHVNGLYQRVPATPSLGAGPLAAQLCDVSLRYPDNERLALAQISLQIPPGSLVAITGPIGAGKSALLRALIGLYPPTEGEVRVDGRPIAEWPPDERAMRIAYLPQEPGLFSGTVRENITMMAATDGAAPPMDAIIARAGLQQDMGHFPQGLDTSIGEGGIQVSGGQRQRIALARALAAGGAQHPGLLLLDDPFASVDVETEGRIIAALREAFGPAAPPPQRATLVLCSHRLAAFPDADHIVVLDQGHIVEQGTHAELLGTGGLYARIYRAQHQVERDTVSQEGPMSASTRVAQVQSASALTWRQVWAIIFPWRWVLLPAMGSVVAGAALALVPPLIIRRLIDQNLRLGRMEGILTLALLYLAATAAVHLTSFVTTYLTSVAAQSALRRLRVHLFAHLQQLPIAYYDRTPIGEVISRCTADMETVETLFSSGVISVLAEALRLVATFVAIVALSPLLAGVLVLLLPFLVIVTRQFQWRMREAERATRRQVGQLNARLQETLIRVEVIRAFHWEFPIVQRFRRVLLETLRLQNRSIAYGAVYEPIMNIVQAMVVALLFILGASPILATTQLSIGTLTAFILLFDQFFGPIINIGNDWQVVQSALAGLERVLQVLALPTDSPEEAAPGDSAPVVGDGAVVAVESVTFGYLADRPVLSNVTLRVRAGQHIAIVGRTGAGKSSLFGLLSGLYRPWAGALRLDGQDPHALDPARRRRVLGAVPQIVWLYSGSVRDNLSLGDTGITEEAIERAARISGADAFIRTLPQGYDTLISDAGRGKGMQVSAGQRQLLSLTRALVGDPLILLLDEATAAVDSATEAAFKQALRIHLRERQGAVITIAHRLSTALEADHVVVLEGGRIEEEGSPSDLLRRGGRLASLWELENAGWEWRSE